VNAACEILGFDPLYVANEGRFIAFVPLKMAAQALTILQQFSEGEQACIIGHVKSESTSPHAVLKNGFGTERYLYRLVGDQLPRIC
jgi:hydrogenase expression/formation protein HypE